MWNRPKRSELPAVVSARHESSQDSYIGCAHVDLSPLACGLSQICGWYNVVDFGGQIQGQLKVSSVQLTKYKVGVYISSFLAGRSVWFPLKGSVSVLDCYLTLSM